jgi:hypothetical protein
LINKIRVWLIKKLIGNKPVIMNVTLKLDEYILASSSDGLFDKCNITYTNRLLKGGAAGAEAKSRNAQ